MTLKFRTSESDKFPAVMFLRFMDADPAEIPLAHARYELPVPPDV